MSTGFATGDPIRFFRVFSVLIVFTFRNQFDSDRMGCLSITGLTTLVLEIRCGRLLFEHGGPVD